MSPKKLVVQSTEILYSISPFQLYHEHIAWCQATALRQVGLLPDHVPYGQGQQLRLPVASGFGTTEKLLNDKKPSNEMFGKDWGVSALP